MRPDARVTAMNPTHLAWVQLALAIAFEITATSALKAADGFTRLGPSLLSVLGYCASFTLLSLSLRGIPLGVAYALWSGIGLPVIALVGWLRYGQRLDLPALAGIALIGAGVTVISLGSRSLRA